MTGRKLKRKHRHMRHDRLRELREQRSWTQQDLADRADVSFRMITRYENGESDPTTDALTKLAKALEVSADYLLGLSNQSNGEISEADLAPMERRLLLAYRASKDPSQQLRNLLLAITSDEELMVKPEKQK